VHQGVGPSDLDWQRNRVVVPGEDFNVEDGPAYQEINETRLTRLMRLGALREATSDEMNARNDAKKAAEEAGDAFNGYSVPEAEPDQNPTQTAEAGVSA
jgi:hypothetical protein